MRRRAMSAAAPLAAALLAAAAAAGGGGAARAQAVFAPGTPGVEGLPGSPLGGGLVGTPPGPAAPGPAAPGLAAPGLAPPGGPATPGAGGLPAASGFAQNRPVTFLADEVEFDQARNQVRARGNVVAWQEAEPREGGAAPGGGAARGRPPGPGFVPPPAPPRAGERVLRADELIYDRTTEIAVLRGNVQLIEPDGQVFFADEAELGEGFREGVLSGVRALLAQNARFAGAGARRSDDGRITDVSRVVYSSCNLCERDPSRPPLWQMRARLATQDRAAQRISYRDAQVQFGGVPVFYTPFFSHPDPSVPRSSGFLFPTTGITRFLGGFAATPYFWAIDGQSDLTITPLVSTRQPPNLSLEYRRLFNSGEIQAQGSIGYFNGTDTRGREELAGHVFSRGRFNIDENWRVGFDLNRASSDLYLRTYRFEFRRVLTSQVFAEGFWGTERYARIDARAYQGLRSSDEVRLLPIVAPNAFYEVAPRQRVLGGWLTTDVGALGIGRTVGSFSQRLAARALWERPQIDRLGSVWTARLQVDARGYSSTGQERAPNFLPSANGAAGDANLRAALDWRLPLVRPAGAWGTQLVEPRVQVVTGPNTGRQTDIPNEDSVDFEFTDANLFSLNRFTGRDRLEGGTRVDAALRGAWTLPGGQRAEAVAGRSFRLSDEAIFPRGTGLDRRASDWVARASVQPVPWFEALARTRLDGETGQHRATDALGFLSLGRVGPLDGVTLSGGYLYSPPLPFFADRLGRNEVSGGVGAFWRTRAGGVWRANVTARYDIKIDRPVLVQGSFGYEDECFVLEGRFIRRFAEDPLTRQEFAGGSVLLVRLGLKTVGDYFFRAI